MSAPESLTDEEIAGLRRQYARNIRQSTHWDGCIADHPHCAVVGLLASVAAAREQLRDAHARMDERRIMLDGLLATIDALRAERDAAVSRCEAAERVLDEAAGLVRYCTTYAGPDQAFHDDALRVSAVIAAHLAGE